MVRVPNVDVDHVVGRHGGDPSPEAALSQLAKVLGSPQFRNSKRSQAMLRFVVESTFTQSRTLALDTRPGAPDTV